MTQELSVQQKRNATLIARYGSLAEYYKLAHEKKRQTEIARYGEDFASIRGKKAAVTNKLIYGSNFYVDRGRNGGTKSRGGGFTGRPELARVAGRKGGRSLRIKYQRGVQLYD